MYGTWLEPRNVDAALKFTQLTRKNKGGKTRLSLRLESKSDQATRTIVSTRTVRTVIICRSLFKRTFAC